MKLVVDANVLFSALIKDSATRRLFFDEELELYAPEYVLEEFAEHRKEIMQKVGRGETGFEGVMAVLRSRITVVPAAAFIRHMGKALQASPDKGDAPYLAAALSLGGCAIWSNDKGLKEQKEIKVVSTSELLFALGQ
ncbi:TPA: PIN domain-containing protein [Candidatus Micrarchaeota archaeon]|nr:PIN domain-containing protein [Candidatus Micrarchaeota archaeon]